MSLLNGIHMCLVAMFYFLLFHELSQFNIINITMNK